MPLNLPYAEIYADDVGVDKSRIRNELFSPIENLINQGSYITPSFANAIERTGAQKATDLPTLLDFYNPATHSGDYGIALYNGLTAPNTKALWIPDGVYPCTLPGPINGTTSTGVNDKTVLGGGWIAPKNDFQFLNVSGLRWFGVGLDGEDYAGGGNNNGLLLTQCSEMVFQLLRARKIRQNAVVIGSGNNGLTFDACVFEDIGSLSEINDSTQETIGMAIYGVDGSANVRILCCQIRRNNGHAVKLVGAFDNLHILANEISEGLFSGLWIEGAIKNGAIDLNLVTDAGSRQSTNGALCYGIKAETSQGWHNLSVRGNNVRNAEDAGIVALGNVEGNIVNITGAQNLGGTRSSIAHLPVGLRLKGGHATDNMLSVIASHGYFLDGDDGIVMLGGEVEHWNTIGGTTRHAVYHDGGSQLTRSVIQNVHAFGIGQQSGDRHIRLANTAASVVVRNNGAYSCDGYNITGSANQSGNLLEGV